MRRDEVLHLFVMAVEELRELFVGRAFAGGEAADVASDQPLVQVSPLLHAVDPVLNRTLVVDERRLAVRCARRDGERGCSRWLQERCQSTELRP